MLVVLHHTVPATVDIPVVRYLTSVGYAGVGFFFALSGFVLTWGARRDRSAITFWRHRFARVWPMWALSVMLAVVLSVVTGQLRTGLAGLGQVLACFLLLQAWVPRQTWYFATNAVGWSLSVEAFFYAISPGIIHRSLPRRPLLILSGLVAAALIGQVVLLAIQPDQSHWGGYIMPLAGLPAFLGGALLALVTGEAQLPRVRLAAAAITVTTLYLATAMISAVLVRTGMTVESMAGTLTTLMLPAWLLLITALAQADLAGRRGLNLPALVRLGEWSFALYLLHQLVLRVGSHFGANALPMWPGIAVACGLVAFALLFSGMMFVCVERPLERRLRGAVDRHPVETSVASW